MPKMPLPSFPNLLSSSNNRRASASSSSRPDGNNGGAGNISSPLQPQNPTGQGSSYRSASISSSTNTQQTLNQSGQLDQPPPVPALPPQHQYHYNSTNSHSGGGVTTLNGKNINRDSASAGAGSLSSNRPPSVIPPSKDQPLSSSTSTPSNPGLGVGVNMPSSSSNLGHGGGMGFGGGSGAPSIAGSMKSSGVLQVSSAEQRMVAALISRLNSKLPSSTGRSLAAVEQDKSYQQIAKSLEAYSGERLSLVAHGLMGLLEGFVKQTASVSSSALPLYVLQSQVLVLRLMGACMLSAWSFHLSTLDPPQEILSTLPPSRPPPMEEALAKYILGVMTHYLRMVTYQVSGNLSAGQSAWSGLVPGTFATKGSGGKKVPGLTATMRDIFRQGLAGTAEEKPISPNANVEALAAGAAAAAAASVAASSAGSIHGSPSEKNQNLTPGKSPLLGGVPRLSQSTSRDSNGRPPTASKRSSLQSMRSIASSTLTNGTKPATSSAPAMLPSSQLVLMIARKTARLIWLVSSFNWNVVWARMRNRVSYLTATNEENPDAMELVVLQWCNLDQQRLGLVLQEFTSNFLHMKRAVQPSIGHILYNTIQQWVSAYPAEFIRLQNGSSKMQGGPDALFEILHGISQTSEGSKIRPAIRPCKAMLLVLCPEALRKAWDGESKSTKKTQFLEHIKKGIKTSKIDESVLRAYMEICRSALLLPANSSAPLVSVELDMRGDLRDRLLQGIASNPPLDEGLALDGLKYLWLRQPETLIDILNGNDKVAAGVPPHLTAALAGIVDELYSELPFDLLSARQHPEMESEARIMARRQYKLQHLGPAFVNYVLKTDFQVAEQSAIEPLAAILHLWTDDPHMAGKNIAEDKTLGPAALQALLRQLSSMLRIDSLSNYRGAIVSALHAMQLNLAQDFKDEGAQRAFAALAPVSSSILLEAAKDAIHNFSSSFRAQESGDNLFNQVEMEMLIIQRDPQRSAVKDRDAILTALTALLLQLTSSRPEIVARTLQILDQCSQTLSTGFVGDRQITRILPVLKLLPKSEADSAAVSSHLHRTIRKALSAIEDAPWPFQAAWSIGHKKFAELADIVVNGSPADGPSRYRYDVQGLTQEESEQFRNLSMFLASTASVWDSPLSMPVESAPISQLLFPGGLSNVEPRQLIHDYTQNLIDLLVADSAWIRASAKDSLAELSPTVMRQVLPTIGELLESAFDEKGQLEASTQAWDLLCGGVVAIFYTLSQNAGSKSFKSLVAEPSFQSVMAKLLNYIDRGTVSAMLLKTRKKACDVISKASEAAPEAGLKESFSLLRCLECWMDAPDVTDPARVSLNLACAQALAALTKENRFDVECVERTGIPLQRHHLLLAHAKFALEYLRAALATRSQTAPLFDRMREYAVSVISAEVALNEALLPLLERSDAGFQSIVLGILCDALAASSGKPAPPEAQIPHLVRLVVSSSDLLYALCAVAQAQGGSQDLLARSLQSLFSKYREGGEIALVSAMMRKEVSNTESAAQLLRSNNMATKILVNVCMSEGKDFFRKLVLPLVSELQQAPKGVELDALDASRASGSSEESVQALTKYITLITQRLLRRLLTRIETLPGLVRKVLITIATLTSAKFPQSGPNAVSAVLILRVLCPLLISPEKVNIHVDIETRKALLLCSKVCNAAATGSTFREPHLAVFNTFVAEMGPKMALFLDSLAHGKAPPAAPKDVGKARDPFALEADVIFLHQFISHNLPELRKAMEASGGLELFRKIEDTVANAFEGFEPSLARRSAPRDTDRAIFFEGSRSMDGKRIFYLYPARMDSPSDTLLRYLLSALNGVREPFHLIVDLTGAPTTITSYAPILARLLYFSGPLQDKARIVMYAPSFDMLPLLRDVEMVTQGKVSSSTGLTLSFAASPSQLAKSISFDKLDLPHSSLLVSLPTADILELEYDGIPVRVQIKDGWVVLQSIAKQELGLTSGASCELTETIKVTEVPLDLYARLGGGDAALFWKIIAQQGSKPQVTAGSDGARSDGTLNSRLLSSLLFHLTAINPQTRKEASRFLEVFRAHRLSLPGKDSGAQDDLVLGNSLKRDRERAIAASIDLAATSGIPSFEMAVNISSGFVSTRGPHRHALVRCVLPWISNIAAHNKGGVLSKKRTFLLTQLVHGLVYGNYDAEDENAAIYQPIWAELGRSGEGLIEEATNAMTTLAIRAGANSPTLRRIAECLGWLAPVGLIARIGSLWRKTITRTSIPPVFSLVDTDQWLEIVAIGELLQLLLDDLSASTDIAIAFPDLMFGLTQTARLGEEHVRFSSYRLWRSIARLIAGHSEIDPATAVQMDKVKIREAFNLPTSHSGHEAVAVMGDVEAIELMCETLLKIVDRSSFGNVWAARLTGHLTSSSFQLAPNQNRSILMLKILIARDATAQVDGDLIYQIVVAISNALRSADVGNTEVLENMVACLAATVGSGKYTGEESFWLAIAILQVCALDLVPAALSLLERSLVGLQTAYDPTLASVLETCGSSRRPNDLLEHATGYTFDSPQKSAFSLAGILLRCLNMPAAKIQARKILDTLVAMGEESSNSMDLLVPFRHAQLLDGVATKGGAAVAAAKLDQLLANQTFNASVMLLGTMLGMLKAAATEEEKINVIQTIFSVRSIAPTALMAWLPDMTPTVLAYLNQTDSTELLAAAMDLVALESHMAGSRPPGSMPGSQLLADLGMSGLEVASFGSQDSERIESLMGLAAGSFA